MTIEQANEVIAKLAAELIALRDQAKDAADWYYGRGPSEARKEAQADGRRAAFSAALSILEELIGRAIGKCSECGQVAPLMVTNNDSYCLPCYSAEQATLSKMFSDILKQEAK